MDYTLCVHTEKMDYINKLYTQKIAPACLFKNVCTLN
jgi:hypothetical protein